MSVARPPSRALRLGVCLASLACFTAWDLLYFEGRARAEGAPNTARSDAYYRSNGAAIGLLFGSAALFDALVPMQDCACDFDWFPGDVGRRGKSSSSADALSNRLVYVAIAEPALLGAAHGEGYRFLNSSIVFSEALAANLTLNTITKLLFPRSRPYSYASHRDSAFYVPRDYHVSFYSSHSSNSFAAAASGAYLFAESARDAWAKRAAWGASFALAGTTALLRVRAGRHYYSDVLVGALVGSVIGFGVPVLHGERYHPDVGECVAAASGLGLGVLVSELLPLPERAGEASFWLAPYAVGGALGLQGAGKF